jgi:hypothetical protein
MGLAPVVLAEPYPRRGILDRHLESKVRSRRYADFARYLNAYERDISGTGRRSAAVPLICEATRPAYDITWMGGGLRDRRGSEERGCKNGRGYESRDWMGDYFCCALFWYSTYSL